MISAGLFVGGSVGLEAWSSHVEAIHGVESFFYEGVTTLEEFGEMSGVSLFIYALLDYLNSLESGGTEAEAELT